MFHVGQKVVCVDDSNFGPHGPWVVKGQIYTVKRIDVVCGPGISVHELPSEDKHSFYYWRMSRFRPLTDTSQSTSFTTGAPRDSRKWDNRRKVKVRA